MLIRDEAERIIREFSLDCNRFHELHKPASSDIINKLTAKFIMTGELHRCWDGRLKAENDIRTVSISDDRLWYHRLYRMIPDSERIYALFEGVQGYEAKYLVCETYPPELVTVLDEICGLSEYYIVSPEFKWLMCETHEDTLVLAGEISSK